MKCKIRVTSAAVSSDWPACKLRQPDVNVMRWVLTGSQQLLCHYLEAIEKGILLFPALKILMQGTEYPLRQISGQQVEMLK